MTGGKDATATESSRSRLKPGLQRPKAHRTLNPNHRQLPPMPYQAVLFDLDGTLLNTLIDLAESANSTLAELGYPVHPIDAYRFFVGSGVRVLFERALPEQARDTDVIEACVERFTKIYSERWDVKTHLYDGVAEMLDGLAARQVKMAVLSNKPHRSTQACVAKYLARWSISPVLGQRDGIAHKPDPTGALDIAKELGIPVEDFLYLGDTATDMQTALAAGMFAVGALWGFRPEEELRQAGAQALITAPTDLLGCLD